MHRDPQQENTALPNPTLLICIHNTVIFRRGICLLEAKYQCSLIVMLAKRAHAGKRLFLPTTNTLSHCETQTIFYEYFELLIKWMMYLTTEYTAVAKTYVDYIIHRSMVHFIL